jgi:hypothetical protein
VAGLGVQLPQGAAQAQDPDPEPPASGLTAPEALVGTSFTYQGRLKDAGSLANGEYDFQFTLHDAPTADSPVAGPVTIENYGVVGGLFTVQLDFGQVFSGDARYLEIGVRPGNSGGSYTSLTPRQELTPAPYALALPGLWTEQNPTSPNILGGVRDNWVAPGVVGTTIGGGGEPGFPNWATGDWATVGGGRGNEAHWDATVAGGQGNSASAHHATIGGGWDNRAGDTLATVGGGTINRALAPIVTIGGGQYISVTGTAATVAGGSYINVAADHAAVGGGYDNDIGDAAYATIGGGDGNNIRDGCYNATIGGGYDNNIANSSSSATIGGGSLNKIANNSAQTTIGGGYQNNIGANSWVATIGGGRDNNIGDASDWATIGGGWRNDIGSSSWNATIGGGYDNDIGDSSPYAFIGGGEGNDIGDSSYRATIGGGHGNIISDTAPYATIPGGDDNEAWGDYSFAAGRRAKAEHDGAFVWADATDADFASERDDQFRVRAEGGVRLDINSGHWVDFRHKFVMPSTFMVLDTSTGAYLSQSGVWHDSSDRDLKESFSPVDSQEVLARLAELPISTWTFKAEPPSIRHMGPTAQDFVAAFGLGADDTHIAALDTSGVALAAIQGLYAQNQDLKQQIDALQQQNTDLEARLTALEQQVSSPSPSSGVPTWLLLGSLVLAGGVVLRQSLRDWSATWRPTV